MALAMIGEGEATVPVANMNATTSGTGARRLAIGAEVMQAAGVAALELQAKEGLALLNGTQLSLALALEGLLRAESLLDAAVARSVPRQEPPYRPLAEVVEGQQVFELTKVEGTLVGFRFPAVASGLEVPGYHLHAITADRTRGGHVLRARVRSGTVPESVSSPTCTWSCHRG